MTSKLDKFENIHFRELEKLYTLSDGVSITKFIMGNSFLLDLLIEAHQELRKFFPTAKFVLSIDDFYGHNKLLLRVYSDLSIDEDETLILAFDKAWWARNLHKAKNLMDITA